MAEMVIGYLAWGALKLTSSLVSAGFKKLVGGDEESPLLEWSGDVVVKAHEKSQQQLTGGSSMRPSDMAPALSRALEVQQLEVGVEASNKEFFMLKS